LLRTGSAANAESAAESSTELVLTWCVEIVLGAIAIGPLGPGSGVFAWEPSIGKSRLFAEELDMSFWRELRRIEGLGGSSRTSPPNAAVSPESKVTNWSKKLSPVIASSSLSAQKE
jgi:hypothetical protein